MSTHSAPSPHSGWGTIAEAAARYGVSTKTVRRMIDRGDVYAERLGPRLIRVDLGSVRSLPLGPATAAAK